MTFSPSSTALAHSNAARSISSCMNPASIAATAPPSASIFSM